MAAGTLRRVAHALGRGRRHVRRHARRTLAGRYRTIVVPLLAHEESRRALDLACRLAAERGARVLLLAPLFVDTELPLDAHFQEEERALREELARDRAIADSYGIGAHGQVVRARAGQLGAEVARAADDYRASLVVVGAPNDVQRGFRRPFSRDVWSILKDAPCRVMLVTGTHSRNRGHV